THSIGVSGSTSTACTCPLTFTWNAAIEHLLSISWRYSIPRSFCWQEGTLWFYTYLRETIGRRGMTVAAHSSEILPKKVALVREILERIADKWTLLVIDALDGERELRFSRLQQRVGGISHKMLTKTLCQLERDGLVTRRVHAMVPPRV